MNTYIVTLTLVLLIIFTIQDIINMHINIIVLITGLILTIVLQLALDNFSFINLIYSCIPGIFMIIISFVRKKDIGMADGLVICLVGISTGIWMTISILLVGFILAAFFCVIGLLIRKIRRDSTLPFIPFVFTAYVINLLLLIVFPE